MRFTTQLHAVSQHNTFLNGYAKKAHPYDFRSVRYLLAGAEKVQQATSDLWSRRFGMHITEAYGVTSARRPSAPIPRPTTGLAQSGGCCLA